METNTTEPAGGGTRAALLAAAAALLEAGGMDAVTLRAVGEHAGVSRQAPYKHFADKTELLSVLAAGYFRTLGAEVRTAAAAETDPVRRLDAMCGAYVRYALDAPRRYRLMFGPETRGTLHPQVQEQAYALGLQFVLAVAACQEAGRFTGGDPMPLASLLYATCHGSVDLLLAGHAKDASGDPARVLSLLLAELDRAGRAA